MAKRALSAVIGLALLVAAQGQESTSTVRPTEEQPAIESTALELSTSPDQVDDATETSSPTTSTTATHSSDKKAASTDRTLLGVAGLVGGVFAFRTRNKRDVSDEWRATSEAAAVTPPLSSHAAWAPPASEVCVVIDDHNFAILEERLPLGAVRTTEGDVVVPASRRADGSTRKPIRIRQGYVPQDETPKYKTVAQRRREQEAKQAAEEKAGGVGAVDGLQMDKLSLEQKKEAPSHQQLKLQLTKINKQLKEIAKLEDMEASMLSPQQKQKLDRKVTLQQKRNEVIAELNGATVTRSSSSSSGPRPKIAANMVEEAIDAAMAPSSEGPAQTEKKEKGPLHFEDEAGLFKTVCRTFLRHKKCKRQGCTFVHDKQLCQYFWKSGACKFGDECRKNHFVTLSDPNAKEEEAATSGGEEKKPVKKAKDKKPKNAAKKNTENFEPMTKPVDLRITYDLGSKDDKFSTSLTSRDVVLVPNLFSDFKKGELYAKLLHELDNCGIPREQLLKMWHGNDKIDGTHLIVDDHSSWKAKCPTFDLVTDRLKTFFSLDIKATRFNLYKDTSQWKPFHFDAAALKPHIAAIQNFTVGISFGATRDAAFEHAETKTVVSMPQPDGCVYAFSRDTNMIWRHGILQDAPVRDEGRISVIAWAWVDNMADFGSASATAAS
uniref:C3H1-type domain-containing protein n=1 Tax=Phytophthora ramorum TaxID=164328 RepID=H3HAT9_PHYRM